MLTWNDKCDLVQLFADDLELTLVYIQPWHLRLSHPGGRKLDYFPKSGRATWVSTNEWFTIPCIETFLNKEFKPVIV